MFSGIIEEMGRVVEVERCEDNATFTIACPFTSELTVDQSLAHNGVCLTVEEVRPDGTYKVTAIAETLRRSNLGQLRPGDMVNLERSLRLDSRLDGHIVQGHVDTTARCISVRDEAGSHYFTFRYEADSELAAKGYVTVEKGSVTVNGVSLTVCDSSRDEFSVAIIPYTFEHTNFGRIEAGSVVNLEFDIIGKYLARLAEFRLG